MNSAPEAPEPAIARAPSRADDRRLLLEALAVVALAVLPPFADAVYSLRMTEAPTPAFAVDAMMLIVRSAQVAAPVLYIMWRSGEAWFRFGLVRFRLVRDTALGLLLFGVAYVVHVVYWNVVFAIPGGAELHYSLTPSVGFATPASAAEWLLLALMSAANGFAEELVIFGFLTPRLGALLRNRAQGAVLAAFLFASYHIYQGPLAAGDIFLFGLVHGAAVLAKRNLWPLVIAHGLADFTAYAQLA